MVLQRSSRTARGTTTFALESSQFSHLARRAQLPGSHTSTVCPGMERKERIDLKKRSYSVSALAEIRSVRALRTCVFAVRKSA